MKSYTHLFFDLDHTLWDYERNSEATLLELYQEYDLENSGSFSASEFVTCFSKVNDKLWDQFHRGEIDQDHIRTYRFHEIFDRLDHQTDLDPELSAQYIRRCPTMGYVFPGAIELLEYLSGKYELHIITNGFVGIQDTKLSTTGLDAFFGEVIISGNTGYRKPQKEIFEYAFRVTKATAASSIMIGDSLESDIQGAKNAQMDQVFFNPKKINHKEAVTFEISQLAELRNLGF